MTTGEKVASGFVMPGWTPREWARNLRRLARLCEAMKPQLAAEMREWADNVERLNPTPPMSFGPAPAAMPGPEPLASTSPPKPQTWVRY